MRCILAALMLAGLGAAQSPGPNRLTASGGWMTQLYPPNADYRQTAPTVGISYGYRVHRFVELEAGVTFALQPGQQVCNRFGCYDPNDRYVWLPVGARLIAPLMAGRLELSLGGGGMFERYWVSNPDNPYSIANQDGWGGYFAAGVAVALDKGRHFWIGNTERALLVNPEFTRHRWLQFTGDVSWRF